jgi:hypothetical protein
MISKLSRTVNLANVFLFVLLMFAAFEGHSAGQKGFVTFYLMRVVISPQHLI